MALNDLHFMKNLCSLDVKINFKFKFKKYIYEKYVFRIKFDLKLPLMSKSKSVQKFVCSKILDKNLLKDVILNYRKIDFFVRYRRTYVLNNCIW